MVKLEDKTLGSIRILNEKIASNKQGSIVTAGGVFVGKNLMCIDEVVATDLIIKQNAKIANDVSIGGIMYCPELYSVDTECIKFKRNIIGIKSISVGTVTEPIEHITATNITCDNMTVQNNFNLAGSDILLMRSDGLQLETLVPNYFLWKSFKSATINYCEQSQINIDVSNIFINVGELKFVKINCDGSEIPDNTKVTIYLINDKKITKCKIEIKIIVDDKIYCADRSKISKIKIIKMCDDIYVE